MHVSPEAGQMKSLGWRPGKSIRGRTRCKGGKESPRSPKSKESTQAQANGDARQERRDNGRMAMSRTR